MAQTFSTYEAKARFSELLRRVRGGQRVLITYHDEPVAELRPIAKAATVEQRLEELEASGELTTAERKPHLLRPLVKSPGALARFLAERD